MTAYRQAVQTTMVFADLHIHIGSTQTGRPVKISASRQMTIKSILHEASHRKGLGMIGVIDCHVPEVIMELKELIASGEAEELSGGGLKYHSTTLILGTEMEILDDTCQGPIHVLCYFPNLKTMERFSAWMARYQRNINLSSQRSYVKAKQLQREVKALDGLFVPAHIFTPYKSVYGKGVKHCMSEVFDLDKVDAVELGLSSDTKMAIQLPELNRFTFLTNSDAHSLTKIGREYQRLNISHCDFKHLQVGLHNHTAVSVNYGLDPKLGKYHAEVSARIKQLATHQSQLLKDRPPLAPEREKISVERPPYVHQVPLEFIPGIGAKRIDMLIEAFGSEMNVVHNATKEELEAFIPEEAAAMIVKARANKLNFIAGGSGRYGKVSY